MNCRQSNENKKYPRYFVGWKGILYVKVFSDKPDDGIVIRETGASNINHWDIDRFEECVKKNGDIREVTEEELALLI